MVKKFAGFVLLLCASMFLFTGCATSEEAKDSLKFIVGTALETAYDAGGATLVNTKIDELVTEGKLTEEQAATLKNAMQKSYEKLMEKVNEL